MRIERIVRTSHSGAHRLSAHIARPAHFAMIARSAARPRPVRPIEVRTWRIQRTSRGSRTSRIQRTSRSSRTSRIQRTSRGSRTSRYSLTSRFSSAPRYPRTSRLPALWSHLAVSANSVRAARTRDRRGSRAGRWSAGGRVSAAPRASSTSSLSLPPTGHLLFTSDKRTCITPLVTAFTPRAHASTTLTPHTVASLISSRSNVPKK